MPVPDYRLSIPTQFLWKIENGNSHSWCRPTVYSQFFPITPSWLQKYKKFRTKWTAQDRETDGYDMTGYWRLPKTSNWYYKEESGNNRALLLALKELISVNKPSSICCNSCIAVTNTWNCLRRNSSCKNMSKKYEISLTDDNSEIRLQVQSFQNHSGQQSGNDLTQSDTSSHWETTEMEANSLCEVCLFTPSFADSDLAYPGWLARLSGWFTCLQSADFHLFQYWTGSTKTQDCRWLIVQLLVLNSVTSHFAPTLSTRPTNSLQVGRRPTSLPTLPYWNYCSGQLLLIQLSPWY